MPSTGLNQICNIILFNLFLGEYFLQVSMVNLVRLKVENWWYVILYF